MPPPVTVRNRGVSWESRWVVDPCHDVHGTEPCTSRMVATTAALALVAGFGGFRAVGGALAFAPRLPSDITRFAFHLWYWQRCLRVSATHEEATYTLVSGDPLPLTHHGEPLLLTGTPISRPIPPPVPRPLPTQPPGRAPAARCR